MIALFDLGFKVMGTINVRIHIDLIIATGDSMLH